MAISPWYTLRAGEGVAISSALKIGEGVPLRAGDVVAISGPLADLLRA